MNNSFPNIFCLLKILSSFASTSNSAELWAKFVYDLNVNTDYIIDEFALILLTYFSVSNYAKQFCGLSNLPKLMFQKSRFNSTNRIGTR
ncbi:hypothetical protein BpHYR1_053052 [Brachionus plicatilis]|uniref:Secreted protein n=1 Tax=Brachionus plicatilis TaxID=10195 RepID=A0A3M7T0R4_BRAPC|nr:hypothetical protein BpHYR1_053052 [Brachionus plicatilis]